MYVICAFLWATVQLLPALFQGFGAYTRCFLYTDYSNKNGPPEVLLLLRAGLAFHYPEVLAPLLSAIRTPLNMVCQRIKKSQGPAMPFQT